MLYPPTRDFSCMTVYIINYNRKKKLKIKIKKEISNELEKINKKIILHSSSHAAI